MTRSWLLRRRIAAVGFGVAVALLAQRSCTHRDATGATFAFDFGSAATHVQSIDVDVYQRGEAFAHFRRTALAGTTIGPTRFTGTLLEPDGELRIDVALESGIRHIVRQFHAAEGATVTIPLERDLR